MTPGDSILSIIHGTTTAGTHPTIPHMHGITVGVIIPGGVARGGRPGLLAGVHHGVGVPPGHGAGEAAGIRVPDISRVMVPPGAVTIGVPQAPVRLAPMLKEEFAPLLPVAVLVQALQLTLFTTTVIHITDPQQ